MLDLHLIRSESDAVKESLRRRGLDGSEIDRVLELDIEHRRLLQRQE